MPLTYPYPPPPPGQTHHLTCTSIPHTEFRFLKRLLPYENHLAHIVGAILLKKLINELRRIDTLTPLQPTLYPDDPTEQLIVSLLDGITFRPVGQEGGSDDQRGTGGAREALHPAPVLSTEPQGSDPKRKQRRQSRKKEKPEEKQS